MKYLKKFENHAAYETYANSESYLRPNVSYCVSEGDVHYNYYPPFFCKLTLNDDSVVEIEGSGKLSKAMVSGYSATCVSAEIGELCTSISGSTFRNFNNLVSVSISNSVTEIEWGVFNNCSNLTSVNISNSITRINTSTFENCPKLESLIIPESVAYIYDYAFADCSGLTSVTVEATTPPTLGGTSVFSNTNNCPIYVPAASVEAYKAASGWSTYASRIQAIP